MPYDVKCRRCGGVYIETNEEDGQLTLEHGTVISNPRVRKFDPDKMANGSMFRLKEPYKTWGWSCFPQDVMTMGDAIECPMCEAPLPDSRGRVMLVDHKEVKLDEPQVTMWDEATVKSNKASKRK